MKDNTSTERLKEQEAGVFDLSQLQQGLAQLVKSAGGMEAFLGKIDLHKELTKSVYELMLETEMQEHLGYEKHSPEGRGSGNSRNGKTSKKVRGDFGEIEISTPRDREGSFEPKIIKKRQSSVGNFTDKIVSLYARGMSTREIEDHLKEMYEIEVSPQFISRATERVQEDILTWQNRPLDKLYPVVYVDGLRVSVKAGDNKGAVLKKCVYTVLGISTAGVQEVLGLWIAETEGARFWLKVLNDLKARGIEDIILLCGDGLTGLPDAVESVYPHTDVQLCVVHQIRNATKYVSWKDRKAFCADMRPIYTAPNEEAAKQALEAFAAKWERQYPMSVQSWRKNWDRLITFMKYPVELRKVIYTTNAIESLHAQMRKNISNRKMFPNDDAVIKILFLNVQNFSNRWTRKHGWDIVMNQLSILFPERFENENL